MEDAISPEILNQWDQQLLGNLPCDQAIAAYDYSQISQQTQDCIDLIWRSLITKIKMPASIC